MFLAIRWDIKSDIDSDEQPREAVNAPCLKIIKNAAVEQKQELHTLDDVTAMVTEQVRKFVPIDDKTAE